MMTVIWVMPGFRGEGGGGSLEWGEELCGVLGMTVFHHQAVAWNVVEVDHAG